MTRVSVFGHRKKQYILPMTLMGAFLALGAPVGYVGYSYFVLNPEHLDFMVWCAYVFDLQFPLLIYLTVPTIVVFSLFGFVNGVLEWRLAEKARIMQEFVHVVSHDMKSPLSVIRGAASGLGEGLGGPVGASQQKYIDMIVRQSRVMEELVVGLLDIHKMEEGKYVLNLERVDLVQMSQSAVDDMRSEIEKKHADVQIVCACTDRPVVMADALRIRQLFRNLVGNALKFIGDKGRVEIRFSDCWRGGVQVSVYNDGPHISAERMPGIFDRFARATQSHRLGYGLGLSICKTIIDIHGGKIWAENVRPRGVCFHVMLPAIAS